jgi:hypothetical protein
VAGSDLHHRAGCHSTLFVFRPIDYKNVKEGSRGERACQCLVRSTEGDVEAYARRDLVGGSEAASGHGAGQDVLVVKAQALLDAEHPSILIVPLTTNLGDDAAPSAVSSAGPIYRSISCVPSTTAD